MSRDGQETLLTILSGENGGVLETCSYTGMDWGRTVEECLAKYDPETEDLVYERPMPPVKFERCHYGFIGKQTLSFPGEGKGFFTRVAAKDIDRKGYTFKTSWKTVLQGCDSAVQMHVTNDDECGQDLPKDHKLLFTAKYSQFRNQAELGPIAHGQRTLILDDRACPAYDGFTFPRFVARYMRDSDLRQSNSLKRREKRKRRGAGEGDEAENTVKAFSFGEEYNFKSTYDYNVPNVQSDTAPVLSTSPRQPPANADLPPTTSKAVREVLNRGLVSITLYTIFAILVKLI